MAAAVKRCDEEEIEEDFMAVVGHRQPHRPKKRPRTVQKKLHVKSWTFANFDESGPLEQWNHTYHEVSRFLEQWSHTYHAYYLVSIVVDREIALEQRVVRRRPRKESATKAERSGSNDAVTYLRSRFTIFCTNPQTKTSNFMILCKTHKPWLDDYKVEETKVRCSACSLVVMLCTTGYIYDEV
ncbi:hypothetical protein YC2023_113455 [Brassica napus]